MNGFLVFLQNTWIIFLILAIIFGAGIAGYFVDKNTDILSIEKKKKELREKSMDIEVLKSEIKDKNVSFGGSMGLGTNNKNVNNGVNNNVSNAEEDLNVPLNLNSH